jgi:RNA polymerase-binding transcription factor DksA
VTEEERRRIEARLDERLQELARSRLAVGRDDNGELAHVDNHPGDIGTELHDEELEETTSLFLEEEERRIDEARRALAHGSYGICKGCGRQIPPERLEAAPEAVRCLDCQRHFEGLHRQRTPL